MIYYMIRHKASGDFMPQLKGKGYTHWNPSSDNSISGRKLTGCPRLFATLRIARAVIVQWNSIPNAYNSYRSSFALGDDQPILEGKPDGRKKDDLEIVEVNITEVQILPSHI